MTPLELLAVGVIVFVVWACGMEAGGRQFKGLSTWGPDWPGYVGIVMIAYALAWLLILGIKEAAK